jgi:hypothetical protein
MDSTVLKYDQQHKVGARTKKKMLGRGGFTHLRERDNSFYLDFHSVLVKIYSGKPYNI